MWLYPSNLTIAIIRYPNAETVSMAKPKQQSVRLPLKTDLMGAIEVSLEESLKSHLAKSETPALLQFPPPGASGVSLIGCGLDAKGGYHQDQH